MKKLITIAMLLTVTFASAQFKQTEDYFKGKVYVASDNGDFLTLRLVKPDKYFKVKQVSGINNNVLIVGKQYEVLIKAVKDKEIDGEVLLSRFHYIQTNNDFREIINKISPVLKIKEY